MTTVLFVSNFLADSGANRSYFEDLADRIEARGWRVLRTSAKTSRPLRLLDMLRTAWHQRRDYEVAHIAVFSGAAFAWAEATALLLRRLGKPYVLSLHGGMLPEFARRWPRRVRRVLRHARSVTAPSRYLCEQMRAYRGDIELVRNAVDTQALPFRARVTPRPALLWIRAFHAIYNPVLAIDVLARLRPDAHLRMIGPDHHDGSLEAVRVRCRELGVAARVEIVGRIPKSEIARALETGDILINTTDADNTPLSILEAMSAGLCVASTSVGGIPYLLDADRDALLVPARDPDAMAAAVTRILVEPGLAARLSHAGRALALEHDWQPVLARWEQILRG